MLSITGPTGDRIQVDDRPDGKRRILIEGGNGNSGGAELTLDAESAREVGLALGAHPLDLAVKYGEKTLEIVRQGILDARPYLTESAITDIINGIMNQGIVFRERA